MYEQFVVGYGLRGFIILCFCLFGIKRLIARTHSSKLLEESYIKRVSTISHPYPQLHIPLAHRYHYNSISLHFSD
ncbi:hypothetical protein L2E82_31338 [Cichorium intybus]|uniref:Uncharacterized protein n=1 Tax=Cichorium intybus TaxID=13427 RepID=A0ACB9D2R3_CICIN|nr:hypothetical protein L2E82_31338 [Cichorium intybus]